MGKKSEFTSEEMTDRPLIIKSGRNQLVSGATYHNFNESPIFKGTYQGECWGKDEKTGEPKVIGFFFESSDNEEVLITNAYSIDKALNQMTDQGVVKELGKMLEITFLGKIIGKTGQPFNRFSIVLLG